MAKAKAPAATKTAASTSTAAKKTASSKKKSSKAADVLIDSHVSSAQAELAFTSLATHATKHAEKLADKDLLAEGSGSDNVWLQVAVKTLYPEKKLKPHKIPLAHPLVDPRTTSVCLITKDPQREYKDLLEKHNIHFISRVVGLEKLKGKFKPFEARRMLLNENGLFLADERVVPLLPKLLGKRFFSAKKQPIPVCLTRKDLKCELERAISATYMHQNQGSCTSIKIGNISQSPTQLLQNLQTALPHIVRSLRGPHTSHLLHSSKLKKGSSDPSAVAQTLLTQKEKEKSTTEDTKEGESLPDPWDNVQSLSVKTSKSMSLPVWSCELKDGGRWTGMPEPLSSSDEEHGDGSEDEEEEEEAEVVVQKKDVKGVKKRAAEEIEDKPAKKARAVAASTVEESKSSAPPSIPIKKPKKSKLAVEPTPISASLLAKTEALTVVDAAPDVPSAASAVEVDGGSKGKKKKDKKEKDAAIAVAGDDSKKDKKKKKSKESDVASPILATDPGIEDVTRKADGLTREEMKQKRAKGVVGEKKKDKLVKGQGSLASGEGRKGKKGATGK